jgi:hypothetical protein
MKKPFGLRIPECIPAGMRDEYLKWKKDPFKFKLMYPVTARIIENTLAQESERERTSSEKRPHQGEDA